MPLPAVKVLLEVCARAKRDEDILIVTDTSMRDIARAFVDSAAELGYAVNCVEMKTRAAHGENPPPPVAAAMESATLIFGATRFSLYHSRARQTAVAKGSRFVNMADYTMEMLSSGPLLVDFEAQRALVDKVSAPLTAGKRARVTTPAGTDIEFSIEGRDAFPQYGMSIAPGEASSPPDIETAVAPVEGTASGKIVVDGSIPQPGIGVLKAPITLMVEKGLVTKIVETSPEAERLKKILAQSGNPNNYNVGECGIGMNPMANFSGSMLEDEGVFGSVHFGIGSNTSFPGGATKADVHVDAMIRKPSLFVDGKPLLLDGEIA